MSRYIDADEYEYPGDLVDVPTADVEKVLHGAWIRGSDADGDYWICSVCVSELPRVCVEKSTWEHPYGKYESIEPTPRCPQCGARMDLK